MKLYVDSNRIPYYNYTDPTNWIEIKTFSSFKDKINQCIIDRTPINTISFDYQLSDGTGIQCLEYLVQKSTETGMPFPKIYTHSETPDTYLKFENLCDLYTKKSGNQYVLENRRRY
jgi:hypothetical protein